ncbi:MAG: nucleotidyltransferase domain-containing protein [Melioribacteraceae bacterium]
MVSSEIIEIVKDYLRELSGKGIYISKAFLFGSQANNTANEESDIDLMLVSPLFDGDTDKYMPAIWLSTQRTAHKIEPIIVGEKRFLTDDMSPIIAVVKEQGIEIAA